MCGPSVALVLRVHLSVYQAAREETNAQQGEKRPQVSVTERVLVYEPLTAVASPEHTLISGESLSHEIKTRRQIFSQEKCVGDALI